MKTEIKSNALVIERYDRTDIFEVCKEFPTGYIIWNIGRANFPFEGYLPLAEPLQYPPNHICLKSLKAIKIDEDLALYLLRTASKGTYGSVDEQRFHNLCKKFYKQKEKIIV